MTGGLAWLNDLMVWLGRWVPRLLLIQPTHRGVRFGPRGSACQVGPGVVVYWPITHVIVEIPVITQSVQLCPQMVPCEGVTGSIVPTASICAAAIQFRVVDVVRAATSALNLHALIDNRTSAAITRHAALAPDLAAWADRVRSDVDTEVSDFGVKVDRLDFTQRGVGVAVKNISNWSYDDSEIKRVS